MVPTRHLSDARARYLQIAHDLERDIRNAYRLGDFLPSELVLAERFGVNRHTLRRAIDELVDAGVVERRRGRGTAVIDPATIYPIRSRTRFTETLESQGRDVASRILDRRLATADAVTASDLDLDEGDPVIELDVLRLVEGSPMTIATIALPAHRFEAVLEEYTGGSLHGHLEQRYGIAPRRERSVVTAVMPRTEDAHLLKVPRNRPLLRVISVNVDPADDRPVERCVTRMRADRCQLEIRP